MTGSFVFAEDEGTAPDGTTTITTTITTVKVVTRTIYNDVSVSLNESNASKFREILFDSGRHGRQVILYEYSVTGTAAK